MTESTPKQERIPRSRQLQDIARDLEMCIARLDALQAGDYRGVILPVNNQLREALRPITERLRKVALQEYNDEQGKGYKP